MRTSSSLKRLRRDERGAVLVVFAAFTIVAVVMLAAVVDLGDQRQERKELTLSTDAAALAAAGLAGTEDESLTDEAPGTLVECVEVDISPEAENPEIFTDVQHAVDEFLERNGDSQPVDCKVARTDFKEGYVVVSADEIVDYAFGPALGLQSGGVSGASVAAIEVDTGGGLRPIGICGAMVSLSGVIGYPELSLDDVATGINAEYGRDATTGYIVDKGANTQSTFTARFAIDKVKGGACGDDGGAGNFGQLDFGGDPNTDCDNNGHFCYDIREGYFGEVDDPTKGETGGNWGNNATTDSLDDLLLLGRFWAPIVADYDGTGNGAEADLRFYAQVELRGYCTNSKSAGTAVPCQYSETGSSSDNSTYFDLEISRIIDYVPAGPPLTDDANYHPPRLCAVNNDAAQIAAGCPAITSSSSTTSSPPPTVTTTTTAPNCVLTAGPTSTPAEARGSVSGGNFTLNTSIVFVYVVAEPADCSAPSATFSTSGDTFTIVPQGPGGANGNEYTVTLTSGSTLKKNRIYTVTFAADAGLSDSVARVSVPDTNNP